MKLGDSIVAATALVENREIYTRNLSDFIKIPNLIVKNPVL
jgi:toxin FitB